MSQNMIIGIDPGTHGAITEVRDLVNAFPLAKLTLRDQWDVFCRLSPVCGIPTKAWIEHVHSMPKQGVASTFKFGRSYGNLEAFLIAAAIPFERVTPAVWQRDFGLKKKDGETKAQKKNRHKALAQEFFPSIRVTHDIADALLIAEYGRRQLRRPEIPKGVYLG